MRIFTITDEEEKALEEFEVEHMHNDVITGAIGGNISVCFVCTSIGEIPYAKCSICGKSKDICDYSKM